MGSSAASDSQEALKEPSPRAEQRETGLMRSEWLPGGTEGNQPSPRAEQRETGLMRSEWLPGGTEGNQPTPRAEQVEMATNPLHERSQDCLLYTSPSPRDGLLSRMPSSA